MAKLYAEITSDKGGRVVGKGGDDYLDITIRTRNNSLARLRIRPTQKGNWEEAEGDYALEVYKARPDMLAIIVDS